MYNQITVSCSIGFQAIHHASIGSCQQSVHLTLGMLRTSQAVSHALAFFWLDGFAVPAPAQVTQTVETVEKVGNLITNAKRWGFICQRTLWQNTNQAMKTKWSCCPYHSRTNLFREPWSTPSTDWWTRTSNCRSLMNATKMMRRAQLPSIPRSCLRSSCWRTPKA